MLHEDNRTMGENYQVPVKSRNSNEMTDNLDYISWVLHAYHSVVKL